MTCNTCGGWGDYPVAGPYPELTITHEPCPECAEMTIGNRAERHPPAIRYDHSAGVFELFVSADCSDYLGCFDSRAEALAYYREWLHGEH